MCPPTEWIEVYESDLRYRKVRWVDGFDGGMEAVVSYLRERGNREHSYLVVALNGDLRGVVYFCGDNLMLLTAAEVLS